MLQAKLMIMSSPWSVLSLGMQSPVTMHNHPASEHTQSSNHPTPIQLLCMSFMCSSMPWSMPCPQPALRFFSVCLSVCQQTDSNQLVSTTAPPFKKIPQAAKQQVLLGDKHGVFLHFNINKRLCFSMSTQSLLCFYPRLTSGKVASYSNNSNFICSLNLHFLGCTGQE